MTIEYKCSFCKAGLETSNLMEQKQEACPLCQKFNTVPVSKETLCKLQKQRKEKEEQAKTDARKIKEQQQAQEQQLQVQQFQKQQQEQKEQEEQNLIADLKRIPDGPAGLAIFG